MATNQQNFRVRNGLTIDGATTGSSNFSNAATGADITYVLPTAQGAVSTALTNDGSGNLSWALPGGGGSTFGNITIAVIDDNTISTTTGDLVLDASSNNVNVTGNFYVESNTTLNTGTVLTNSGNVSLFDTVATTIDAFGAATVIDLGASGGITNFNGDIDVKGGDITNTTGALNITSGGTNTTITLTPDGTGEVDLNAPVNVTGLLSIGGTMTTTGATNLVLNTNNGTNSGQIQITNGAAANILITPNTSGDVYLESDTVFVGDINSAATISTYGTGDLTITTNTGTNSGSITIAAGVNGALALTPDGTGITTANTRFTAVGGSSLNNTVAIGGASVDSSGLYPIIARTDQAPVSPSLFVDNTDSGRVGNIILREYGQNRPGGLSTTNAVPQVSLEGKRGTATSTGAGTQTASGMAMGAFAVSGFNGTNFVSETGTGGSPSLILSLAAEDFVADTASFDGYTVGTTLTVTSGTNVHPGLLLSATGILDGTCISAYGTGTGGAGTYTITRSQTLFSAGTPGSFTGAGTRNAGTRWLQQYQPVGMKFNTAAGTSSSRQSIMVMSQTAATTTTVSGVTIPYSPSPGLSFGDNGLSTENILTSADGNTRYNRIGLNNVNFVNGSLVVSGVTANDTATVTADITGTTMTVSAVTSGTLSVGQQVYGSGVSQLTRITAIVSILPSGVGTYTITPSQTVVSTTMVTGPDNYQLGGSNNLNIVGARQSGIPGRRQPLKNGDIVGAMTMRGVNVANAAGFVNNSNIGGRFTVKATEDYSTTTAGSRFTIETAKAATSPGSALIENISTASDATTFKSDAYTFQDNTAATTYATIGANGIGFPVKTAAQWNAITGVVGKQVSVSDSPTSGGRMAFWDTTNARWSYVSDNTAV